MSRQVVISGTDPSNPKTTADVIGRIEAMSAALESMAEELTKLHLFAGSGVRIVLHYDQSMPDKRAAMIARDVAAAIDSLSDDADQLRLRMRRVAGQIADCGVNLRGKYEWRPSQWKR